MNAIDLLTQQHREVEDLFEEFEDAGEGALKTKERLCQRISDALAVHAEIEEKIFYPAAKRDDTEELLRESLEEHLAVKRLVADLVQDAPEGAELDAKMQVLREQVEHHVEEEEGDLFPKTRKALSREELEEIGGRMQELADDLESRGSPRDAVPGQTDAPPKI
ncbi:MAG: hemerythrin domain-containing protein [Anaeromyxobacteraceae bacterium]